jgi:hypothetical protein
MDGLVNRGQTGGREIGPDLGINLFDAGMVVTAQKNLEDRHPLRGDAALPFAEPGNDGVEASLQFLHNSIARQRTTARKTENDFSLRITDNAKIVNRGGWEDAGGTASEVNPPEFTN